MDSENQESKVHSSMNVVPNSSVKNRKIKIISSEKSSVDCIVVAPEGEWKYFHLILSSFILFLSS